MGMDMLVHLDLKGAPPTISFLEAFLRFVGPKGLGLVNGVLVEYEDVFPLSAVSPVLSDEKAWSMDDVKRFVTLCADCGLRVVPLVQTLGHFEYVLKHKAMEELREVKQECNCLKVSLGNDDPTMVLLEGLLKTVLSAHPDAVAIHVGGDEAWHLARGAQAQDAIRDEGVDANVLYLRHMNRVVSLVKRIAKPDIRILMWDDMLRAMPLDALEREGQFLRQVEPVVWQYTPTLAFPESMWSNYRLVLNRFWVASAFKGATSSCARLPSVGHHVSNHIAWRRLLDGLAEGEQRLCAQGLILTGWQRFDHFASLCELLPVAVPSLVCCVRAFLQGRFESEELEACRMALGFEDGDALQVDARPPLTAPRTAPRFPGSQLFLLMHEYENVRSAAFGFLRSEAVLTWTSDWQLSTGRCWPSRAKCFSTQARRLRADAYELLRRMEDAMEEAFSLNTVQEWSGTYFQPIVIELDEFISKVERALTI